jgi:hypothetical protein
MKRDISNSVQPVATEFPAIAIEEGLITRIRRRPNARTKDLVPAKRMTLRKIRAAVNFDSDNSLEPENMMRKMPGSFACSAFAWPIRGHAQFHREEMSGASDYLSHSRRTRGKEGGSAHLSKALGSLQTTGLTRVKDRAREQDGIRRGLGAYGQIARETFSSPSLSTPGLARV